ncbi:class I SAM-dependent methyltransferase [Aeromicrobium wangtongii]|uniref:class I SAM-dependent methyltransferase n=1 Tax=Aeromicrobium wangtongii TaxID=2969247 RepID=UPI002016E13A|nr:class I SAM-dependent methyltransferase [Aeromicrobium wangtongii]MCL3817335.1 class I SAM-dependent methyltransferase [Aeromicrobium wangtongii]
MSQSPDPSQAAGAATEGVDYTDRLKRVGGQRWKQVLDVQRPYRWNARRLLGDRHVLDVGCGIGRNLEHLSPNAVGVDHNASSIRECRARGLRAFTTDEFFGDFESHRGAYTGLIAAHLVEHMRPEQAVEILRSYSDALAPKARVVLICPQEKGYASDETHVTFSDLDTLSSVARDCGWTVQKQFSFPFPRPAGKVFRYNEFVLVAEAPGA